MLCDQGKSYKSSGVKRVAVVSIRTCSNPKSRNTGQRMSASCGATSNQASDVRGATRLDANPTAKWPMNTGKLRNQHTGWCGESSPVECDANHGQLRKDTSTLPDHRGDRP